MTEEEEVKATVRDLGVTEAEARFIVAIERGEIDGDESLASLYLNNPPANKPTSDGILLP